MTLPPLPRAMARHLQGVRCDGCNGWKPTATARCGFCGPLERRSARPAYGRPYGIPRTTARPARRRSFTEMWLALAEASKEV